MIERGLIEPKYKEDGMTKKSSREFRAVVYMRVASSKEGSTYAVDLQRRACEQIAAKYDVSIVREYIDVGRPARLVRQRELQQLLIDLEHLRDAAYVIVSDYARLGRDLASLDDVIRRIGACEAQVVTLTGVESAGRLARTLLLEQVSDWTRREVERDLEGVAEAGVSSDGDELAAAVEVIRNRQLTLDQREALATLVQVTGQATLPTPVVAAVFSVIEACKRVSNTEEQINE